MPRRHGLRADALIVEVVEGVVVDEDVPPPGAVLEFFDVLEQGPVGVEELVFGPPLALDQGVPDEQFAGDLGVDRGVVDRPASGTPYSVTRS